MGREIRYLNMVHCNEIRRTQLMPQCKIKFFLCASLIFVPCIIFTISIIHQKMYTIGSQFIHSF